MILSFQARIFLGSKTQALLISCAVLCRHTAGRHRGCFARLKSQIVQAVSGIGARYQKLVYQIADVVTSPT